MNLHLMKQRKYAQQCGVCLVSIDHLIDKGECSKIEDFDKAMDGKLGREPWDCYMVGDGSDILSNRFFVPSIWLQAQDSFFGCTDKFCVEACQTIFDATEVAFLVGKIEALDLLLRIFLNVFCQKPREYQQFFLAC